jgi:hypothetical protein
MLITLMLSSLPPSIKYEDTALRPLNSFVTDGI